MSFLSLTKIYHNDTYPAISPNRPELSQKDKVVVITGGAGRIGAATALGFATAGAKVAIMGRTQSTLDTTASGIKAKVPGATILAVAADITDEVQTNKAFENVHSGLGKIDIFISNVGLLGVTDPIAISDIEKYWHVFEINTKGPLIAAKTFLRFASPEATVVDVNCSRTRCQSFIFCPNGSIQEHELGTVNSGLAHVPPVEGYSAYQASKLASMQIFNCLGAENPGLTVFNLQPAVVKTSIQNTERVHTAKDDFVEYGDTVELPGHFMVWLSIPEAKFLKGKYIWANWDVDELKSRRGEIEKTDLLTVLLEGWPFEKK